MNFLPMFNAHINYIFITILLLQFFLWTKTTSTVDIEHSLAQLEMDATSLSWQRTATVKELRPAVVFTPLRPRISDFNFCKDEHKYAYVTSALYSIILMIQRIHFISGWGANYCEFVVKSHGRIP